MHLGPAQSWELRPPIPEHHNGNLDCPAAEDAWVEKYMTRDELAHRLCLLTWEAAPKAKGGRGETSSRTTNTQKSRVSQKPAEQTDAKTRPQAVFAIERGKQLKRVFPVDGGPHRRWSPHNQVRHCLRVREPGEVEPKPWFESKALFERVLQLLAEAEKLRDHVRSVCGYPEHQPGTTRGRQWSRSKDESGTILVKGAELETIIRAMLTRPLVLLAGVSGSGKTQIARRLGKAWVNGWFEVAYDENGQPKKEAVNHVFAELKAKRLIQNTGAGHNFNTADWYELSDPTVEQPDLFGVIAVQSDWTDASHLWGYHVPLPAEAEGFYGTQAVRVFLKANQQTKPEPAFLLLDEMNLSRPEHYGSDLLSAMELIGAPDGDVIEPHKLGQAVRLRGEGAQLMVPPRFGWPRRLLVMGTVNVDETTFSFAPKVLDRAALLEFVDVDLGKVFPGKSDLKWLEKLNTILKPYNLHIAYRAAKEIFDTLELADNNDQAKQQVLCNKVLPRVRGPKASVEDLLFKLLSFAKNESETSYQEDVERRDHLRKLRRGEIDGKSTAERKINQMLLRADSIGFTSFFG